MASMPAAANAAPHRNINQRMEALAKGNRIRSQRAQLKDDLKAGRVSVDPLLANPPAYLETMKVLDLLLALPKVGRVKALKALQTARISPSKTVGGLTDRQRREMALFLPRPQPGKTRRRGCIYCGGSGVRCCEFGADRP